MTTIHPSAVIEGDVRLADDVEVGPGCVLRGTIEVGPGTRLIGQSWIEGPARVGAQNTIYPFVALGFAPQSVNYDKDEPGEGLVVGDRNIFRESVSIHRAMTQNGPTRIGDDNFFMTTSHVGHDSQVGNGNAVASGAKLAGHVELGDRVTIGGGTMIHQYCRIGSGAMLSGGMATSRDLPPRFMLTGNNLSGSVNLIGMRRAGMSRSDIDTVRWVHRLACREALAQAELVEALCEREDDPIVTEYIEFFRSGSRPWCTARGSRLRGTT